jgi:hypothetical protein
MLKMMTISPQEIVAGSAAIKIESDLTGLKNR